MDLQTAKSHLRQPLHFGDHQQVEALHYIELLRAIYLRVHRCRYCGGAGYSLARITHKPVQCGCIRNEPPRIKWELGLYPAIEKARRSLEVIPMADPYPECAGD